MKLEASLNGMSSSLSAKIASDEKNAGGGGDSTTAPILDASATGAALHETITAPEAQEETSLTVAADAVAEAEPPQDEDCVEKEAASGKKKGTRKKRSLNWEEAERGLLLEVIKPKVDYVENRSVDAKSIKAKRLAWMQITKQFNALNFRHRSLEQIQVQWRSMKNAGKREHQQKHPKSATLEGMELIEFMEELQKDPVTVRSQTRGGGGVVIKKEPIEMDDEEDTPLAALPTATNVSDDAAVSFSLLQTAILTLPSPPLPPPSAEPAAISETAPPPQATPTRSRKKPGPQPAAQKKEQQQQSAATTGCSKPKRQRSQNSTQSEIVAVVAPAAVVVADAAQQCLQLPTALATLTTTPTAASSSSSPVAAAAAAATNDDKYKKPLFELMKRARLAEMDYARREHEQKLRFEQAEQDLKLRQLRDVHETRMRHYQAEHEARLRAYSLSSTPPVSALVRNNAKSEITNDDGNAFK